MITLKEVGKLRNLQIGVGISAYQLACDDYRKNIVAHFNAVTPDNAGKWLKIHPEPKTWNFSALDDIVDFAEGNGLKIKGHPLLWHKQLPQYVKSASARDLKLYLRDHIHTLVAKYRGRIDSWDVVNEPLANDGRLRQNIFLEKLGPGYILEAFQIAHDANPDAQLILNDFNCEGLNQKSAQQFKILKQLIDEKAPIHQVGMQMHVTVNTHPDPVQIRQNINRIASLGLKTNISEMDVRIFDPPATRLETFSRQALGRVQRAMRRGKLMFPQMKVGKSNNSGAWFDRYKGQAEVYHSILEACCLDENLSGITFWGLSDKHSWVYRRFGNDKPLLFDENFSLKPAYFAVSRALALMP